MIESILVPIDGSEPAGRALALAGDLAGHYGAKLAVLHVPPREHLPAEMIEMAEADHLVPPPVWQPGAGLPGETLAALRDRAAEQRSDTAATAVGRWLLDRAQQDLARAGAPTAKLRLEEGDPAEVILRCLEEEKADLLVMGRRGLSRLQGLLLGSLSQKLSQMAPCSCLLVK